jgi:hypothetical protein
VPDSTATIPEYQCKNVTDRAELHAEERLFFGKKWSFTVETNKRLIAHAA